MLLRVMAPPTSKRKLEGKKSWRGENLSMPKHLAIWKLLKVGSGEILPNIWSHRFPTHAAIED